MTAPLRPDARSGGNDDLAARRKRALRTALAIGAIAVAIYIAFILSGVAAA